MTRTGSPAQPHLMFLVSEDWYFSSHRLSLARAAQRLGYRVSVGCRTSAHADEIRSEGIEVVQLPFRRGRLGPLAALRLTIAIRQAYRSHRPDIVHQVALGPVIFGTLATYFSRRPAIVNALGGLGSVFIATSVTARLRKAAIKTLLRLTAAKRGSILILQNADDENVLTSAGIVDASAIRRIPGVGVEVDDYDPSPPQDGVCTVVLPARLLRDKGVEEFVAAARTIRSRGIVARFVLVGAFDEENPTAVSEDQVAQWVADGVVEYWGWRGDMAAVYAGANIVCLPSYREGLPKSLLEACAAARPIVATDVPGCRDVVSDGVNGLLVPARDAVALADALQRLIESKSLRLELGGRGRERAERDFRADTMNAQTTVIYDQLMSARNSGT